LRFGAVIQKARVGIKLSILDWQMKWNAIKLPSGAKGSVKILS
jgi:hypothetical protein